MASVMPLIQQLVISRMAGGHSTQRIVTGGITSAVSLFLFCIGMVFAFYAENLWLRVFMSPDLAALSTAASAFAFSAILAMTVKTMANRRSSRNAVAQDPEQVTRIFSEIMESFSDDLGDPIRENPKTALMLASLAGFVAGETRP